MIVLEGTTTNLQYPLRIIDVKNHEKEQIVAAIATTPCVPK
jgi:hypothetical protein